MTHAPIRTCLGCRAPRPKRDLVRLVRHRDGRVVVDASGPGRGAYVCADPGCVERALKGGRLTHAFRAACRLDEGLVFAVLAAGPSPTVAGDIGERLADDRGRGSDRVGSGGHVGAPWSHSG